MCRFCARKSRRSFGVSWGPHLESGPGGEKDSSGCVSYCPGSTRGGAADVEAWEGLLERHLALRRPTELLPVLGLIAFSAEDATEEPVCETDEKDESYPAT